MYVVINANGHYESYYKGNGNFICSGDTESECIRETEKALQEAKANENW